MLKVPTSTFTIKNLLRYYAKIAKQAFKHGVLIDSSFSKRFQQGEGPGIVVLLTALKLSYRGVESPWRPGPVSTAQHRAAALNSPEVQAIIGSWGKTWPHSLATLLSY